MQVCRRCRRRRKALPCASNVVGGAKRQQTTLPAHGSAFMQLPRRRRGCGGDVNWAWVLVGVWGVCMCTYSVVGGGVVRVEKNYLGPRPQECDQNQMCRLESLPADAHGAE